MAEVPMYVVHVTQKNSLKSVTSEEFLKVLEKYNACAASISKDPMKYVATLLFKTKEERAEACLELNKMGIDIVPDKQIAYVEEKYLI